VNGSGKEASSWDVCVNLAKSAIDGTFKPVDSHWNAYYNPKKCNPKWASKLIGAETVGHHTVGQLKDQTQHAINLRNSQKKKTQPTGIAKVKPVSPAPVKLKNYTVKDDDTLWSIAGKKMSIVNQIKALNGLKSDTIHPGQTLKIPA
jgi:LysM repeat protein